MMMNGVKYNVYVFLCIKKSFLVVRVKYDVIIIEQELFLFIGVFLIINYGLI